MTLKITNIRKRYIAPYAEMVVCDDEECMINTVSGLGEDPGGGGDNPVFSKGVGGIGKKAIMLGDRMKLLTFLKISHEEDVILHIALDAW